MCGIIGLVSSTDSVERLLDGLKRLEYRGYDSAGIAITQENKTSIIRVRAKGKISELEKKIKRTPITGNTGIGHTRWATHGAPTITNAHPHISENIALVHNGIIENFLELREELKSEGAEFITETDTEVIPNLLQKYLTEKHSPKDAVISTIAKLKGAFAVGIIFSEFENLIIAAKQGSPLAVGYGENEMYLGSDALVLAPLTNTISYLEDGDIAVITTDNIEIFDKDGNSVEREKKYIAVGDMLAAKGHYRHYMLKEIYEQPTAIGATLKSYYHPVTGEVILPIFPFELEELEEINIVACGTSFYAGMTAKYWIEQIARVQVNIDIASEFRYRKPILKKGGLTLLISQSGETADTLAALRYAKAEGQNTLVVVNVNTSSMAREADAMLETRAGPEIGVASTKAFTTQLMSLACFTLALAVRKKTISEQIAAELSRSLSEISSQMLEVLNHDKSIKELSRELAKAQDIIYIGRGLSYPIALEGALKLKEISYIHAEASAAGELKHGPIALIDENTPIIAIAPSDELFEKMVSNINEVAARGGKIILLSDEDGIEKLKNVVYASIELPKADPFASPILCAIPVQLIAYHVAVIKGTDVDQPRNLAKSVTVE